MGDEIELVSDGQGVAVIGSKGAVERFLASERLPSTEMAMSKLGSIAGLGGTVGQAAATVASESGRWVKLTAESAEKVKRFGLQQTGTPGVKHAMIGQPGKIREWIQIEDPGALMSMASNPAVLAGAAGVMSQVAMEQQMAQITDYLERIDEKLDDVLRSQTNQVLSKMDAVGLAVREAETVRDAVGRVSDVTWSKVQGSSASILETQAYALRQLADLTEKIEDKARVDELVKVARQAETDVQKWLTVLARCFQVQDAVAVIELDRVMDTAPHELDQHRLGLEAARRERLELISDATAGLVERMEVAAGNANSRVLFNPIQSPAVVTASNKVSTDVHELRVLLEIESSERAAESRRWREAASEQLQKAREVSVSGAGAAKDAGAGALGQVKSATGQVSGKARDAGSSTLRSAKGLGGGALGKARSVTGKLGSRRKTESEEGLESEVEVAVAEQPSDAATLEHLAPTDDPNWPRLFAFLESDPGAEELDEFVRIAYELGLIVRFDWPAWHTEHGARVRANPGELSAADAVRVLTAIVRGDRFSSGTLEVSFQRKEIDAILSSLQAHLSD